jgi:PAS domain S-box-containing protein
VHLPLSTLANSQAVSVIITDTQGLATWVNEATERLSGYSAVEFIGRKPGAVLQCERTDPLTIERMGGAVRDRQPVAVQVLNRRKDGSDYWTRLQILPWDDEQGRPIGFVSFQFDATQEKEAMDAALNSRERMLSTFSHELRTPLNALIQFNDLLAASPLTADQQDLCLQAKGAAQSLLLLVNDILDRASEMGRSERPALSSTDLPDLLHRIESLVQVDRRHKEVTLSCSAPTGLPKFMLQGERLYRVLLNLVANALKYTEQGQVRLVVEAKRAVRAGPSWDLRFSVGDTGIGMTQDQVALLMKPFSRVHDLQLINEQGTGLGLMLCDEWVKQMGSSLQVHSVPGLGTHFWFTLAADEGAAQEPSPQSPATAPALSLAGRRVLLVDDNRLGLTAAARQLRRFGAEVTECSSGAESIAAVAMSGVTGRRFDLVLMDLQMPEMDGLEATRRILAMREGANLPIVALTAGASIKDAEAARAHGMRDVVTKPFSIEALGLTLSEILRYSQNA